VLAADLDEFGVALIAGEAVVVDDDVVPGKLLFRSPDSLLS
jgi:hypothetical protein